MNSKRKSDAAEPARSFPKVLEAELGEFANEWGPKHRREVAAKWESWARQLRFSAGLIERLQGEPGLTAPTEISPWAQRQLRDAAELERIAATLRQGVLSELGCEAVQPESARVLSEN